MQYQSIRVVRRDQFDSATAQTPGSQRLATIHPEAGIDSPMWDGLSCVEPAARTAIHYHGEQHTIANAQRLGLCSMGQAGRVRCHPVRGRFPLCSAVASPPGNQSFERSSLPMDRRPQHFRTYRFESAQHVLG